MNLISLEKAVSVSAYPGRGVAVGLSEDGKSAVAVYFIMGRSANSRNRVFVPDGDGLRTQAFDPKKMVDPSLIIYRPIRLFGDNTIVTNGDQTDTVYDFMARGKEFQDALRTRAFEPDAPNFTPRISALIKLHPLSLSLSVLKSDGFGGCQRNFFEYESPAPGTGYFIHTYMGDGNPLPSFAGEPEVVSLSGDEKALARSVWNSLNPDNRVSLIARFINLETGKFSDSVINGNNEI